MMRRIKNWLQPVRHLVRKEFRQVFRTKPMLGIIFVMPIIQLFVLSYAATTDVRNIRLTVLDQDRSAPSRQLAESFYQNDRFLRGPEAATPRELNDLLFRGQTDITLWIPIGYAETIAAGKQAEVGIAVDGQNASGASAALGYAEAIVRRAGARLLEDLRLAKPEMEHRIHRIEAVSRFFYNPELESRNYMVPAIVVLLLTIVSAMLTGMAVVREKEIGTLEQLMVTPISPAQLIIGKLVPFAVLSYFELALATTVAVLWFAVPLAGSLPLLAAASFVYLLVTLGGGLLASTVSQTQQQAMFTVWFFLVFGIMTSGFFYPIENMPPWIYVLTYLNPMRYFMSVIRGIFLKGATVIDLLPDLLPLLLIGILTLTVAALRFKKRLA